MPKIRNPRRLASLTTFAVAFALAFVACSPGSSGPIQVATGSLLAVSTRGGECATAPCGLGVIIERDGRVHAAAKPPNDLGVLPAAQLAALDAAIKATDFTALRSHKFTGDCPTAVDGQEFIFDFGAPGGIEEIATCSVAVDFGSPLFVAVSTAIGPYLAIPTT